MLIILVRWNMQTKEKRVFKKCNISKLIDKTIQFDILLGLKSEDSSYDARLFASANQLASARFLLHRGV